jgi:hypothetical protein
MDHGSFVKACVSIDQAGIPRRNGGFGVHGRAFKDERVLTTEVLDPFVIRGGMGVLVVEEFVVVFVKR